MAAGDEIAARLAEGHDHIGDRRHAGRDADDGQGAGQLPQPLLQIADRGVGDPAVGMGRAATGKGLLQRPGALGGKGHGVIDRKAQGAIWLRLAQAAVDGGGGEAFHGAPPPMK